METGDSDDLCVQVSLSQEELTNSLMEMTSHFAKVHTYFLVC